MHSVKNIKSKSKRIVNKVFKKVDISTFNIQKISKIIVEFHPTRVVLKNPVSNVITLLF